MELKTFKIDDIIPYEKNARKNDEAVDFVIDSIEENGYIAPIIVDENNVILAGHTRHKALKAMGIEEVECVVKEGLTEAQKKGYRIADNKTGEKAKWDFGLLESEIKELIDEGYDVSALGFSENELDAIVNRTIAEINEHFAGQDEHSDESAPESPTRYGPYTPENAELHEPHEPKTPPKPPTEGKDLSGRVKERYEVIIECDDEAELEQTYQELSEVGYRCRVLIL